METVTLGDSLHEMSNFVFLNKSEKCFKMTTVVLFFFDCETEMRTYYFCKHLMK